jgi:serine/threonine protein kinase
MLDLNRVWSTAELRLLMSKASRCSVKAGEILFHQGEKGQRVYLVRQGLVEIFTEQYGVRRRLSLIGRGEVIGEMAVLDDLGRSATAMARTDLIAYTLDKDDFEELLDREPKLVRRLTQTLSRRYRLTQNLLLSELDRAERRQRDRSLQTIGPYRLLEELGSGGMGVIYKATHHRTGLVYAVKVLSVPNEDQRERFSRECEMMARLIHPNVTRIEAGGLEGYYGYLAMELLMGQTLEERLRRGPLSLSEVRKWFLPAMRGLHHAHGVGVIHRDVKPENLFLTLDGTLKLLDFGIARRVHGPELTVAGRFFGTTQYIAPERIGGQSTSQERLSDQYSLGATLYAALTGRPLFDFDDVADILAAHLHRSPIPPSRLVNLKPSLETVIMRMLEKDPLRRFASMELCAQGLEQSLAKSESKTAWNPTVDFNPGR